MGINKMYTVEAYAWFEEMSISNLLKNYEVSELNEKQRRRLKNLGVIAVTSRTRPGKRGFSYELTEKGLRLKTMELRPPPDQIHTPSPPRHPLNFPCTECNKRYASERGLHRHFSLSHPEVYYETIAPKKTLNYFCSVCGKGFPSCRGLKIHSTRVHNRILEKG